MGGFFLAVTSLLTLRMATSVQIVAEEAAKLLGVAVFFVGHLAAFAGTVREIRKDRS